MIKIKYFMVCSLALFLLTPIVSAQKMTKKEMTALLLKMDKQIDSLQNVIQELKENTVPIKKRN